MTDKLFPMMEYRVQSNKHPLKPQLLKVSDLDDAGPIQDTDMMEIVQTVPTGIKSRKITVAQIKDELRQTIDAWRKNALKWINNTYTILNTDGIIRVDAQEDMLIVLPNSQETTGKELTIKRVDFSGWVVSVVVQAGDKIENGWDYRLLPARQSIRLFSDGEGWQVVE